MEAEQRLIASNALIGAARALYFPRISLTGLGGFASATLSSLFAGPAKTWSYTGDVAGPIFTGGGIRSANDQAVARREQALASYRGTIQNAFREVEDALVTVRTSRQKVETLTRSVQVLRRGLQLAQIRYDNGYSDALDVLDTERSLFNAELALTSARGDRYRAIIDLYRALGGDWENLAEKSPSSLDSVQGHTERRP
jgi:multidrug efflux system outer membrane protein